MDPGEHTPGTRDEHYDLVSVLYHALQGADTCNVYALDAEAAGDERLAAFFREASVVQTQLAERAKGMLGITGRAPPQGASRGAASRRGTSRGACRRNSHPERPPAANRASGRARPTPTFGAG